MKNINILIVYSNGSGTIRRNVRDLLYCYRRYSGCKCYYLNIENNRIPRFFYKVKFDIVIYHVLFFSDRWSDRFIKHVEVLRDFQNTQKAVTSIIETQDEYFHLDKINNFVNQFDIDYILTVMPEQEWPQIFKEIDQSKVKIKRILTGYIDNDILKKINKNRAHINKSIDLVYRAAKNLPCLGRQALLKYQLADIFCNACQTRGISYDISTNNKDSIFGFNWYRFLLKSKYTIGIEGGASILDYDGEILNNTLKYLDVNKDADFEEVESAVFAGLDGEVNLVALSPRHLEACATKTCQILIEGEYNGILKPNIHYIELKRNMENLDDVMNIVKEDSLRDKITEAAYKDIVESNLYSYETFVKNLIKDLVPNDKDYGNSGFDFMYYQCLIHDLLIRNRQILIGKIGRLMSPKAKKIIKNVFVKLGLR